MTLLSKIAFTFVMIVGIILLLIFVSLFSSPAHKVEQFFEATKQGKCNDIDKYFVINSDNTSEEKKANCWKNAGKIDSYRTGDTKRWGVPGLLEWANVSTEVTLTDGKVAEGNHFLFKFLFMNWKLTEFG